ncbi:MAG TPA: class I SAM-dependent methyltransferase, partial [Bacteroidia bacterium]|nr:class I SAM-dependent methyltransferase [Bacteroidia bacterium]
GEKGAYSGARFDGDFSMTIDQAQEKKHKFIVDNCNIKKGSKVLDIGCGWGAFVNYMNNMGVNTTGVVLAQGQADACLKNGMNIKQIDSKTITPEMFGKFDAVTAMGSPEHLCSVEEYKAGQQEKVYDTYMKQINSLLPVGGRFYCQTMVFGPNMVKFEDIPFGKVDIWKKSFTNEELMAMICDVFPGSWLPYGKEGIINPALKNNFKLVSIDSGRLDYMETIDRWSEKFMQFSLKKYLYFLTLIPRYLTNREFRDFIQRWKTDANLLIFEREVFEHYRIVFEKIAD